MIARERLVRVVAEAVDLHRVTHTTGSARTPVCRCGTTHVVSNPQAHQAEAVVAALEAEMGLRVESEPVSSITLSGPGGTLTLPGPEHTRLVTDWVSDEGDG